MMKMGAKGVKEKAEGFRYVGCRWELRDVFNSRGASIS